MYYKFIRGVLNINHHYGPLYFTLILLLATIKKCNSLKPVTKLTGIENEFYLLKNRI